MVQSKAGAQNRLPGEPAMMLAEIRIDALRMT
jgi:hypothetical protein